MEQNPLPHHHTEVESMEQICSFVADTEKFDTVSSVFRQLQDPNRLRIFWFLCHCNECVTDIAAAMGMSAPAVSHHLRELKNCGLIVSSRAGKEVYYRAASTKQAMALHLMVEHVMQIACPG